MTAAGKDQFRFYCSSIAVFPITAPETFIILHPILQRKTAKHVKKTEIKTISVFFLVEISGIEPLTS